MKLQKPLTEGQKFWLTVTSLVLQACLMVCGAILLAIVLHPVVGTLFFVATLAAIYYDVILGD